METEYLKEYIAFSKTLSYAKTAEELFISQPTLRAHLRALEGDVGAPLTMRRAGQTMLSPVGKCFLKRARDIVSLTEDSLAHCQSIARESASLLIGFLEYPWLEDLFIKARENLGRRHPEKKLDLLFSPKMHANVEAIVNEDVDVTVLPLTRSYEQRNEVNLPDLPAGISSLYLGARACHYWMTKSNALFAKEAVAARDLDGATLLLGNTQNMNDAGPKFRAFFESAGARIEVDNQPFPGYADYFLSDESHTFGIILEGHRFEQQAREDFRIFSVPEFTVFSDLYILFDASRFNECGTEYLHELELLAGA